MGLKTNTLNFSEQEIIDSLLDSSKRRKGEEKLFNTYSYFIREAMHKYSLLQEDAFDAYSDTILSAIDKIISRSFEARSSLKTFIYQVFHNKCVDQIRRKATNKDKVHQPDFTAEALEHLSDASKSILQNLSDKSDLDALKLNLKKYVGENCRLLLLLCAEGYTDKEIAVFVKYKSADVVKSSRLRCMEKLRQLYKNL